MSYISTMKKQYGIETAAGISVSKAMKTLIEAGKSVKADTVKKIIGSNLNDAKSREQLAGFILNPKNDFATRVEAWLYLDEDAGIDVVEDNPDFEDKSSPDRRRVAKDLNQWISFAQKSSSVNLMQRRLRISSNYAK